MRRLALAAAAVALTGAFVVAGFPVDRMAPRITADLTRATGARVEIGSLDMSLGLLGPAVVASKLDLTWPGGFELRAIEARFRPAWSLSWLRLDPAVAVEMDSNLGEIDGTVYLGSEPGYSGDLRGLVLERLPPGTLGEAAELTGSLDAEIDLNFSDGAPVGSVNLVAREGSVAVSELPVALPFETLSLDLELGGESLADILAVRLDGPMIAGRGAGTVGHGQPVQRAPLRMELELEARDPSIRDLLRSQGLPIARDGTTTIQVGGTLGSPGFLPAARAPRRPGAG